MKYPSTVCFRVACRKKNGGKGKNPLLSGNKLPTADWQWLYQRQNRQAPAFFFHCFERSIAEVRLSSDYTHKKGWIVGHRGNFYFARISAAGSGIRSVIGRGRTQDEAKERAAALYLKSLKKQFLRVNFTCEASAAIPSNELLANTELIMSPNRGDNKREHEDTIGATRPSKRRKPYKPHQPRQSFCTKLSCTHEYAEKAENARIRFTELLHRQELDEGLIPQRLLNVRLEKASADEAFYAHRAAKGFCIAYGLSGDPQWKQRQLHYVERAADSFFRACQYAWDRKTKKKNVEQCMRMMAILAVEGRRSHNAVKMIECSLRNELALTKPGLNHSDPL